MKPPAALDPEFTAEDWSLVERLEAYVEGKFQSPSNCKLLNLVMEDSDGPYDRRHYNEFVKRARAVGWSVAVDGSKILIEKPPLGEIATTARLMRGYPATNLTTWVQVIGTVPVECILDVYLDDAGLERLLTMHRLGVRFSPKLRLLTSQSGAKNLSKAFVNDVLAELGCQQGEIRVTTGRGHEGRFMLLDDASVVALGCSLNGLDTNERAHRSGDQGERADFETRWKQATLPSYAR
jgi:hypothetical protein